MSEATRRQLDAAVFSALAATIRGGLRLSLCSEHGQRRALSVVSLLDRVATSCDEIAAELRRPVT